MGVETTTFDQRACLPGTPPLASYVFKLMLHKQSNLCLSADVETSAQLLEIAEECGDKIVLLKTHCDIVSDFSPKTARGLQEIAARKKFLIFEDRKFGDIGNTVQMQYAAGPLKIAQWATITNAHIFPGPAIITALRSAAHSTLAALHSTFSTEIKGGAESYFEKDHELNNCQRSDQDEPVEEDEPAEELEEEEEYDGDEKRYSWGSGLRAASSRRASVALDRRKSSVVSISTTISSSTEYISPPATSTAASPAPPVHHFDREDKTPSSHRGLLLLAQMSSADNFFTDSYTSKCVQLARQHRDFVIGFIAQEGLNTEPDDNFIVMTPGVSFPPENASTATTDRSKTPTTVLQRKPNAGTDKMGQQYNTPRHVILERNCDVIIVGRGIYNAGEPARVAEKYRDAGWAAYCERVGIAASPRTSRHV